MNRTTVLPTMMLILATPAVAYAEENWLLGASGAAAAPINETHANEFGAGAVGELGVYRSLNPWFQLGGRVGGGVLDEDEDSDAVGVDHGRLGIFALAAAARVRPLARATDVRRATGLWLEGAAGPGVVDEEFRAVLLPGAGYIFDAGSVGIGPMARYIHVFEAGSRFGGEDAQIATVGLELMLFDARPSRREPKTEEFRPGVPAAPAPPMEPAQRVEPALQADADSDGIVDSADDCPNAPEVYNEFDDQDGCPDEKATFIEDRMVVEENVFFDYDKATLREQGKAVLRDIAEQYRKDGESWYVLRIQGHADRRGSRPYNVDLSKRRARAVEEYLAEQGVPQGKMITEAYGEGVPVVDDADERAEFQKNRRVEFIIEVAGERAR